MKKFWAIASAVAAAAVLTVGIATPASAYTRGNAYVVVNNSVCGSGSSVRGILLQDSTSLWSTTAWDNGDNIVYPQVLLGTRNNLQIQAACAKPILWGAFWQPDGYRTVIASINPTANGQTFRVG